MFEVMVRAAPCLPLWGRWQPEGLTEEVFGVAFCEKAKQMQCGSEPLPTSLRSATLPKGEGKNAINNNFYSEVIDIIQRFCRDGNRKMLIPQPPGRAAGR